MDTPAIVIGAGQAGIAAALALSDHGFRPVVLEAGSDTAGSWPCYYDSLRLFTPAHMNALPGKPFPGDPHRYPTRDEVAAYLRQCAAAIPGGIHTGQGVATVDRSGETFRVRTTTGAEFTAPVVVSATGGYANPYRPEIPGLSGYTGEVLHAAEYRRPQPFTGQRVVVIGSGNSAIQIAIELAAEARVVLAHRTPLRYATNDPIPADSRFWRAISLASRLPIGRLFHSGTIPIVDTEGYRDTLEQGNPAARPMFVRADGRVLHWPDGRSEVVDTVVLATGYRPALAHLSALCPPDAAGFPPHRNGISAAHPGLAFLGLEYQRNILSGTLHGVGRDSRYLARHLARYS
ncbi:NAD(P)-binding domain-containing protein [Nocardia speluncae]|uniref:NAD(P)-binding domain-containing protein n=1 Tax=Nocardia speluncae TaxID=419477 RepID=A0A846XGL6_9NOCA|nr:NAD(P)/FAD-dependent oxidoreductase [Nocardia speluncae]NKY35511.1 NAD(P)-binding domain-containing protein [Nocardia speluncae]